MAQTVGEISAHILQRLAPKEITHSLAIRKAVGLNFCTSGWLFTHDQYLADLVGHFTPVRGRKEHTNGTRKFHTCWRLPRRTEPSLEKRGCGLATKGGAGNNVGEDRFNRPFLGGVPGRREILKSLPERPRTAGGRDGEGRSRPAILRVLTHPIR